MHKYPIRYVSYYMIYVDRCVKKMVFPSIQDSYRKSATIHPKAHKANRKPKRNLNTLVQHWRATICLPLLPNLTSSPLSRTLLIITYSYHHESFLLLRLIPLTTHKKIYQFTTQKEFNYLGLHTLSSPTFITPWKSCGDFMVIYSDFVEKCVSYRLIINFCIQQTPRVFWSSKYNLTSFYLSTQVLIRSPSTNSLAIPPPKTASWTQCRACYEIPTIGYPYDSLHDERNLW